MKEAKSRRVTMIMGDGIGPEIMEGVALVLEKVAPNITIEKVEAGLKSLESHGQLVRDSVYESMEKNRVVIKGPITTPVGQGFRSVNVALRQRYDLFANIRPIVSIGNACLYKDLDLVIFRENTEGLYIGMEEQVDSKTWHATKVVTQAGSQRIIKEAFEFAKREGRKKVSLVHKANILKQTDGNFLRLGHTIAEAYPAIEFEPIIVDNMCMQLVMNPHQFDVIVTMNLYGDILSDLCAGLVGGLGLIPGANIGKNMAIFEAVHGSAPDIAGQNVANPTGVLLSAVMMLEYLGQDREAKKINDVIGKAMWSNQVTKDLGGHLSTSAYIQWILGSLE